jgi:hypothetical protein
MVRRLVMPTAIIRRGSASPPTVPFAVVKSVSARTGARQAPARRNFSLAAEKAALIHSLRSAEKNWFAMCSDFRDAGQHWLNIKMECRERKISAGKWAAENAPLSKRWLDRYAEFAARWDEFRASWKWSQSLPYSPERRVGLVGCFDLIDAKKRFDTYSQARQKSYRGDVGMGSDFPIHLQNDNQPRGKNPIRLSATATLLHGDVTEMMVEHIGDASIDLAIADVPYFLRGPKTAATDLYTQQNGAKPLFNEEWDHFDSIEQYETFCTAWIDQTMRCLHDEGSLFIFGSYHNSGLINRLVQMRGYVIINEIVWVQKNARPNVATRRLQASHHNILWIAKDSEQYRFNYRLCKRSAYDDDWLSKPNQQLRERVGHYREWT